VGNRGDSDRAHPAQIVHVAPPGFSVSTFHRALSGRIAAGLAVPTVASHQPDGTPRPTLATAGLWLGGPALIMLELLASRRARCRRSQSSGGGLLRAEPPRSYSDWRMRYSPFGSGMHRGALPFARHSSNGRRLMPRSAQTSAPVSLSPARRVAFARDVVTDCLPRNDRDGSRRLAFNESVWPTEIVRAAYAPASSAWLRPQRHRVGSVHQPLRHHGPLHASPRAGGS